MEEKDRKLRQSVINFFLDHSRPPTIRDLSDQGFGDDKAVSQGLSRLRDAHHLKLYDEGIPSPSPIAMAHPFAHLPTPNVVTSGNKSWWANCAWCAFGLASMLSPAPSIVHVLTASGECARIPIVDDEVADATALDNYHAVFSAPPSQWWKDVHFACSGIQVCTSYEEAESWHEKHGFYKGDIISLGQLWKLSKAWYHDKASLDYERKSSEEKEQLFREIGMTSGYWAS